MVKLKSKKKKVLHYAVKVRMMKPLKHHLCELGKEMKKSAYDENKLARLLSLTYARRRSDLLSVTASTRISSAIKSSKYLMKPVYVRY